MIPYGRQNINQQDIDAVVGVLKSDYLTQGCVKLFRRSLYFFKGIEKDKTVLEKTCTAVTSAPKHPHKIMRKTLLKYVVWGNPLAWENFIS